MNMKLKHKGDKKQYIHFNEAWYADANRNIARFVDEVNFGFYDPEGGTSGEMSVRWIELGRNASPTPQLRVFNDAWSALGELTDVIAELAKVDDKNITPEEFCGLLDRCGFKNATPRKYTDSYLN